MIVPDLSFKFITLPSLKLVSTPLSRLLLGKSNAKDAENVSTNFHTLLKINPNSQKMFSGFVTLDSEKRVFPLMPTDPFVREQPIVGIWLYGVTDLTSPYVWAACARFVFCRNFKNGASKMASNFP
jgi:hypothetical protein